MSKDVSLASGSKANNKANSLNILRGVDLQVAEAETVAILGGSGSGKTTLLSLLAGLDLPSNGECWLDGQLMNTMDEDGRAALRAGRVGFVFQSFQLLPGFSALENVLLAAELAGVPNPTATATSILEQVGLGERTQHPPHRLSGGEQQRVAIARAFAGKPRILFADEPTGNLDIATGERIIELLFELNRAQHTTLILVTHDAALAERCQRVLHLRDGVLHEQTT
ncbi:MAG: ATP-binding cassette domain-containing protein [Salinisphaeraceae bacterium]|nr:ATP-binding cassette domain-containing protein [Salinisphaeraceae bacterium]